MLEARELTAAYSGLVALADVSITVAAGEIVCVAGANGAGKSTLLKTIAGLERPRSGAILFEGERIDHLAAHRITARGIAFVPENRRLFPRLSVRDNLRLGRGRLWFAQRELLHELPTVRSQHRRGHGRGDRPGERRLRGRSALRPHDHIARWEHPPRRIDGSERLQGHHDLPLRRLLRPALHARDRYVWKAPAGRHLADHDLGPDQQCQLDDDSNDDRRGLPGELLPFERAEPGSLRRSRTS